MHSMPDCMLSWLISIIRRLNGLWNGIKHITKIIVATSTANTHTHTHTHTHAQMGHTKLEKKKEKKVKNNMAM